MKDSEHGAISNRSSVAMPLSARFMAAISNIGDAASISNGQLTGRRSSRRASIIDGVNLAIATKNKILANAAGVVGGLFRYSVFLSLFLAVTMSRTLESIPYSWKDMLGSRFAPQNRRLSSGGLLLAPFQEIHSKEALWMYLEQTLAPALVPDEDGSYGRSLLTGQIRAGQARSKSQNCGLRPEQQWLTRTTTCFSSNLNKDPFGGPDGNRYSFDEDGQRSINQWLIGPDKQYGTGAYYAFLSQELNQTMQTFQDWKVNHFIDMHTRALFIDFTLYHPSLDMFSMVRILFEMPIYGGVVPNSFFRINTVKFYDKSSDYAPTAFECLFLLAFIKMMTITVREIGKLRWDYFKSTWNIIECMNMLIFVVIILTTIVVRLCGEALFDRIQVDSYVSWQSFAYSSNQLRNLTALNAVLTWIRILKYMRISSRMSMLEKALTTARTELLSWIAVFLAVYLSFVFSFYIGFHQNLADYKTFSKTAMTLFHGSFGHLDFEALYEQNTIIGPVLGLTYVFCTIFMLINMLLVILEEAWTKTLEEIKVEQVDGLAAALSAVMSSARSSAKKHKKKISRLVRKNFSIRTNGTVSDSNEDQEPRPVSGQLSTNPPVVQSNHEVVKNQDDGVEDQDDDDSDDVDDNDEAADDLDDTDSDAEDKLFESMMTPRNFRRSV